MGLVRDNGALIRMTRAGSEQLARVVTRKPLQIRHYELVIFELVISMSIFSHDARN
jgi:hypothetical protein